MTSSTSDDASSLGSLDRRWIYHMTHIANVASILESGTIYSHHAIQSLPSRPRQVSYSTLQDFRRDTRVPVGPGGSLHNYVPFYFCSQSPMLYAIHKGKVGDGASQAEMVFFLSFPKLVSDHGLKFVFTDGHAIMAYSRFFTDLNDLNQIDWNVLVRKYWNEEGQGSDGKRRRQAEFLVRDAVPLDVVKGIAVFDEDRLNFLTEIMSSCGRKIPVKVLKKLYF